MFRELIGNIVVALRAVPVRMPRTTETTFDSLESQADVLAITVVLAAPTPERMQARNSMGYVEDYTSDTGTMISSRTDTHRFWYTNRDACNRRARK